MNAPAVTRKLIDIREGESIDLAGIVSVQLVHKTGRAARLQVVAPREVTVEKRPAEFRGKHGIVQS